MTKQQVRDYFGSYAAAAKALGIARSALTSWDDVPLLRQYQLQVITNGTLTVRPTQPQDQRLNIQT